MCENLTQYELLLLLSLLCVAACDSVCCSSPFRLSEQCEQAMPPPSRPRPGQALAQPRYRMAIFLRSFNDWADLNGANYVGCKCMPFLLMVAIASYHEQLYALRTVYECVEILLVL